MYYFASDVHLGAGDESQARRTERRFVEWLDMAAADAEAIVLMGDIFDFWFEYENVIPKGFSRVLGKLSQITDSGVRVLFFAGNHDMWCRDYLQKECGVEIYHKPEQMRIYDRNLFLAHGDNMNIGDKPMLRLMNTTFRSKLMRRLFSWLVHPDLALRFGKWWSGKSRKSHAKDVITPRSLDFLVEYALNYHSANPSVEYIIFGHMHYPYLVEREDLRILFLSAWECEEPQYATLSRQGELMLKTFIL